MRRQPRPRGSRDDGIGVVRSRANAKAVCELAARQHGVVTRGQLIGLGLGARAVDRRVEAGLLRITHRGVYLVGPIRPPHAHEMAAVLACGDAAFLSLRSAAALWDLLPYPAQAGPVHVTVVGRNLDGRPEIRVHRTRSIGQDERTTRHGIPITTPARTILDLAAEVTLGELEQAMAKAERNHLTSRRSLHALLARYSRRRGAPALRRLLARSGKPAFTRSQAERRFLALIRKASLPAPDVNVPLDGYEVDFLWREERLVVESDGFEFHSSRASFEADRARDAALAARGLTVIRVTWRQIRDQPEATLVRIAQALVARL